MNEEEIMDYFRNRIKELKAGIEKERYENTINDEIELKAIRGILKLYKEKQKENQELKKRINKTLGIMDHLDSLDAEQFYEVDQVLKGAENHIPRID